MSLIALGLHRIADHQRHDMRDRGHHRQASFAELRPSAEAAAACCASRSTLADSLRWRTRASAPATSTGDSEVVKMKPGA